MVRGIIKKILLRKKWRKLNPHNSTCLVRECDMNLIKVGNYTYGGLDVLTFNNSHQLSIGCFCSIAPDVVFILSADHYLNHLSTFPFKSKIISGENEGVSKGDIIVDSDVWIGKGSTILSGVHIGQGAVIAAGAVVSKDVPPYAIVGGMPAKVIKYRFEQSVIDYMLTLDYDKLNKHLICKHSGELYSSFDEMGLDEIKKMLKWFPKK